jgi:hypothetical protein
VNEQLQQQLAEYLKAIATTAEKGAGFVIEQAPLVVQEKIAYGRVVETATLVAALAGAVALYRFTRWSWTQAVADDFDNPLYFLGGIVGAVGVTVAAIGSVGQFNAVAMVWFAPRLYILEWALSLIK